jgi:hypothetical protein
VNSFVAHCISRCAGEQSFFVSVPGRNDNLQLPVTVHWAPRAVRSVDVGFWWNSLLISSTIALGARRASGGSLVLPKAMMISTGGLGMSVFFSVLAFFEGEGGAGGGWEGFVVGRGAFAVAVAAYEVGRVGVGLEVGDVGLGCSTAERRLRREETLPHIARISPFISLRTSMTAESAGEVSVEGWLAWPGA